MNTVNLRRYSEAGTLRELSPRTLVAVMDNDREFLAGKGGGTSAPLREEGKLDYQSLATIFLSPDDIRRGRRREHAWARVLPETNGIVAVKTWQRSNRFRPST
jgi:hypothetical protein